jgi:hypothetical protein
MGTRVYAGYRFTLDLENRGLDGVSFGPARIMIGGPIRLALPLILLARAAIASAFSSPALHAPGKQIADCSSAVQFFRHPQERFSRPWGSRIGVGFNLPKSSRAARSVSRLPGRALLFGALASSNTPCATAQTLTTMRRSEGYVSRRRWCRRLPSCAAASSWFWVYCKQNNCTHRAPMAFVPLMIRWGPDTSLARPFATMSRSGFVANGPRAA